MIIHRGISENSHWSLSKKKSVFSEGNGDAYILVTRNLSYVEENRRKKWRAGACFVPRFWWNPSNCNLFILVTDPLGLVRFAVAKE